jgi:signal peptidase
MPHRAVTTMFRRFRGFRRIVGIVGWAMLGALVGLALALAGPYVVGARSFTVMSGSMEPTIHTGDVVVGETISPRAAKPGDVVTFPAPDGSHRLITHRLRSTQMEGGRIKAETKGDANNTVERWQVPADGHIGRVVYRVPRVGYVLASAVSPRGRFLVLVAVILAFTGLALERIWRSSDGQPQSELRT